MSEIISKNVLTTTLKNLHGSSPPWPFQYRGLKVSSTVALDQILRGKKRNVDKWLVPILLKFTDRLRFGDDQSYIIP